MASSLAQQLAQARSYNAAQLESAKSSAKALFASYLFPPNVAATQDLQTLQALASNGWEELTQLDATFVRWNNATGAGDLLFGDSSRELDRFMKTKEENEEIDRAIADFLHLSGGSLLDRSTGKCLEWLFRRFRIHEHNVESVLAAFMPYHETQEFARMLQLLNLKNKPHFDFLLPIQKKAVPLPSSILISTLLTPPSSSSSLTILRWIIGLLSPRGATRFRRPNHALQAFWFSTIMKFCDQLQADGLGANGRKNLSQVQQEDNEQQYLSILLPAGVDAAVTTQLGSDCQIGGCLILSTIATVFNLSTEAKESITASLAEAKMDGTRVQKAYEATVSLLRGADGSDHAPAMDDSGELNDQIAVAQSSSVQVNGKAKRAVGEELEALLMVVSASSEDEAFEAASKVVKLLSRQIDTWAPCETLPGTGQDAGVGALKDAVLRKPHSRRVAQRVQTQLLYEMAVKVDASNYIAITRMDTSSNLAASVYTLAISTTFVNAPISSVVLTTLFSRLGDASLAFLASIWTTTANSTELRYAALHHAQSFLAAFTSQDAKVRHVDFQVMLPSLIIALRDSHAFIRVEALQCLQSIAVAIGSIGETNGRSDTRVEIYGYDSVYGQPESESIKYLDTADALRFTRALLQARNSFEHDALYINRWLQTALTVARGEGKRESSFKRRVLEAFLSHILAWTSIEGRQHLLLALADVHDASKLQIILPLLAEALRRAETVDEETPEQSDEYLGLLFAAFDVTAADAIEEDEGGCWQTLMRSLDSTSAIVLKHAALRLQKGVFSRLSEDKKKEVYSKIINLVASSTVQAPKEVQSCSVSLDISADTLAPLLSDLRTSVTSQSNKSAQNKRAKTSAPGADQGHWLGTLSDIVEILEALLARKAGASAAMVSECFEMLRLGTELILSHHGRGEYLMQISMSNLSLALEQVTSSNDSRLKSDTMALLRADIVINVIKTPCRPQTFQQALLLLSRLARASPEAALHNAMPVFTFVGSTMLQRDDDYSFVVIERTLQSILPAVVKDVTTKAASKKSLARLQAVRPLLSVFTDAAKHIPRHRRVPFFTIMVQVLGVDYLAPICMLLTDRYASKVFKQEEDDIVGIRTTLQLPLSLFSSGGADAMHQWGALLAMWDEVIRHWTYRGEDALELQDRVFLDCMAKVGEEHEGRRASPEKKVVALIRFIYLALLACTEELEEHSREVQDQPERKKALESLLWSFIEKTLTMSQVDNLMVRRAASDVLTETMKIASVDVVFAVTSRLLGSKSDEEKSSGLQLCTKSLANMSDDERAKAGAFTPDVIRECYQIVKTDGEATQPALEVLSTITQDCLPAEHVALAAGLPTLINGVQRTFSYRMDALRLLISLAKHLGPRLIPQLNSMLSMSTDLITASAPDPAATVLALELLSCLARSVPIFFASHVGAIIRLLVDQPLLQDLRQLSTLLSAIVRFVPSAELLSTLLSVWEQGDKSCSSLHLVCLGMLERMIKAADRKVISTSYKATFRYLLSIVDARRQASVDAAHWNLSADELASVEDKAVSVFLRLVLKLNENAFRPLFLRFCDWALVDLAEEGNDGGLDNGDVHARKVVLFKVINAMLAELGELVSKYYLNVLDAAVSTLEGFTNGSIEDEELWRQIVTSLQHSARADKDRGLFWNENRSKAVMPGLISQISVPMLKQSSGSLERLLGDGITWICRTVPDESTLKMANNQLLEMTRSTQSKVKIVSIRILEKVWKSKDCEDTLLRLVPETVPSIAELLQESDMAVQEELAGFVAAVEQVLGENLDGYLQ